MQQINRRIARIRKLQNDQHRKTFQKYYAELTAIRDYQRRERDNSFRLYRTRKLEHQLKEQERRLEDNKKNKQMSNMTKEFHFFLRNQKVIRMRNERLQEKQENQSTLHHTLSHQRARKISQCQALRQEREDRLAVRTLELEKRNERIQSYKVEMRRNLLTTGMQNERKIKTLQKELSRQLKREGLEGYKG